MGEIRPDDGGAHFDDLPALPPEWGMLVVPDDPSALDAEAQAVRRELREQGDPGQREAQRPSTRPGSRMRAGSPPEREPPSFAVPVAVMLIAMLTTLISLAVVTVGQTPPRQVPAAIPTSAGGLPGQPAPSSAGALTQVSLADPTGGSVRLGTLLPAVILLIDECRCEALVLDVARGTPAGVTVVALAQTPPVIYGAPTNVRTLAAAADSPVRTHAAGVSAPPGAATVIVVGRAGHVVRVIPGAQTAADILPLTPL